MPSLATTFTVVAPDARGVGLSDKPRAGYDTASLAADMVGLMSALNNDRFAVVGHDVGMWIAYALAADHAPRVSRVAMAEALVPGLSDSPPLFMPKGSVNRQFHFASTGSNHSTSSWSRAANTSSSVICSRPRRCGRSRSMRSTTTSRRSPETAMPYEHASSSTEPSTPRCSRTNDVAASACACPS